MIKTCETMVYCISKPNEWGIFDIQLFNFTKTAEVSEGIWSSKKNEPQNLKCLTRKMMSHIAQKQGMFRLRRICERSSGKLWICWVIPSPGSRFPILSLKWIDRSHTKPGVLVDSRLLFFRALGGAVPGFQTVPLNKPIQYIIWPVRQFLGLFPWYPLNDPWQIFQLPRAQNSATFCSLVWCRSHGHGRSSHLGSPEWSHQAMGMTPGQLGPCNMCPQQWWLVASQKCLTSKLEVVDWFYCSEWPKSLGLGKSKKLWHIPEWFL